MVLQRHFLQYISYIVDVSCCGGGDKLTYRRSLTNLRSLNVVITVFEVHKQ